MGAVKELSLAKGAHKYVFRYAPGCEAEVISAFANLASDTTSEFDWFDAAVLSYQMGRRIETDMDEPRAE